MAINLNTVKALFGKLAPYADDVAKGVANYGDDAARLVGEYGDDVAKVATNYGDDVARAVNSVDYSFPFDFTNHAGQHVSGDYTKPGIWNIDGKTFHDLPEGTLRTNQSILKQNLLDKRTGREFYDMFPKDPDVSFLGHADRYWYDGNANFVRGPVTIDLPGKMSSEYLVFDDSEILRPHKNTALGRWFDKNINTPKDWKYFEPYDGLPF